MAAVNAPPHAISYWRWSQFLPKFAGPEPPNGPIINVAFNSCSLQNSHFNTFRQLCGAVDAGQIRNAASFETRIKYYVIA